MGEQIEAWHNGKIFHRDAVLRTVAAMDLFWILDDRTGTRKLIDTAALLVLPADAPNGQAAAQRLARPASHMPLFQAPAWCPDTENGSGADG